MKFVELMASFVGDHGDDINKVAQLGVGWEAWAQVEIARYCTANSHVCRREWRTYGQTNRSKADFVFHDTINDIWLTVELKCAILGEAPALFAKRVSEDVAKLCLSLDTDFKKTHLWVIGIFPLHRRRPTSPGNMDKTLKLVYGQIYETVQKKGQEIIMTFDKHHVVTNHNIAIFWWKGEFKMAQNTPSTSEDEIATTMETFIDACVGELPELGQFDAE